MPKVPKLPKIMDVIILFKHIPNFRILLSKIASFGI